MPHLAAWCRLGHRRGPATGALPTPTTCDPFRLVARLGADCVKHAIQWRVEESKPACRLLPLTSATTLAGTEKLEAGRPRTVE